MWASGAQGLFNFKPSVRPVPLEAHIQGYPGKFYCPRMATMNKPTYAAIQTHSPIKPVLVFVSRCLHLLPRHPFRGMVQLKSEIPAAHMYTHKLL